MSKFIVRDYNPKTSDDAQALDLLLGNNRHGDVRLDTDIITLVDSGDGGALLGCAVGRPVIFVHEFQIKDNSRAAAELLLGWSVSKLGMMGERQAHFLIDSDNKRMQTFMEDHGAFQQPKQGVVYTLLIPEVLRGRSK